METNDANASSHASGAEAQDTQTGVAAILNLKEELLAKVEEKAESQNAMINSKVDQLRKELQQATEAVQSRQSKVGKADNFTGGGCQRPL